MPKKQVWSEDGLTKRCSKCGAMKTPDSFHNRKLKSGVLSPTSWCKECSGAKALADMNARYRDDPEWREKRLAKDRVIGQRKRDAYRAEHPRVLLTEEEKLRRKRAHGNQRATKPEVRERARQVCRNYRALKKLRANGVVITKEQWRQILEKHDHRCAYCKVQTEHLEQDHVIPLTRGGSHTTDNLVPACRACNTSKNNRTLDEWTPPSSPQAILRVHGGRRAWKLTDEQVAEIRARRAAGEKGRVLAKAFGVHEQYISELTRHRRTKR